MKKSFAKRIMLWTALAILVLCSVSAAEDGYEFWLRYHKIPDKALLEEYRQLCKDIIITENTPILNSAKEELVRGLSGLRKLKPDGFLIRSAKVADKKCTIITGNSDRAVLYGVFGFLRLLQTHQSIENLDIIDNPVNPLRMVNHWDNPNGSPALWSGSQGLRPDAGLGRDKRLCHQQRKYRKAQPDRLETYYVRLYGENDGAGRRISPAWSKVLRQHQFCQSDYHWQTQNRRPT